MGNVVFAFAKVFNMVLELYSWIIIIRALISFVNPDPYNPIVRALHQITEPVLGFVRRTIPCVFGGLDLSPLVVILLITFLQYAVVKNLFAYAARLGAHGPM